MKTSGSARRNEKRGSPERETGERRPKPRWRASVDALSELATYALLIFGLIALQEYWDQLVQVFVIALLTIGAVGLLAWIFLETGKSDAGWKSLVIIRKLILYPLALVFFFFGWDSLRYGNAYFLNPTDAREIFLMTGDAAPSAIWALINMAIGAVLFFLGVCLWLLGMKGTVSDT